VHFVCCICRWETTKAGRKNARNSKKNQFRGGDDIFWKILEKYWHNPQIFKSRYRSRNVRLESQIFWSLGLAVSASTTSLVATRLRLNVCVGVHQKRVNIKSASTMSATMTSWSSATLAAKSILHTVHLQHRDFHKRFYSEVLRANGDFHPKWNFTKYKLFKLANSMKMDFVFRLKSEHNCS